MDNNYTKLNSEFIDKWANEGWEWGQPIDHETFEKAKNNDWSVVLTPTKPVPKEWFCEMKGAKVLGLASGGGQQMPIFSALGAECTVLDYSEKQLQSEKEVAKRESYEINLVKADMTKPLPFNPLKDKELYEKSLKNDWGIQFSHTIEEQIGGQLQAGFILTDIFEDINGQGRLHDFNVPTFYATRAVKK